VRDKHSLEEAKQLVPTSFGPEESELVALQHQMKKNKMK